MNNPQNALPGQPPQPARPPALGVGLNAEVIRIIDGDTVEVRTEFVHRLRLEGCWAPETRLGRNTTPADKRRGLAARARLTELLRECDFRVRLHIPGHGGDLSQLTTLSRAIGRIWRRFGNDNANDVIEPDDLSSLLVAEGFAEPEKP